MNMKHTFSLQVPGWHVQTINRSCPTDETLKKCASCSFIWFQCKKLELSRGNLRHTIKTVAGTPKAPKPQSWTESCTKTSASWNKPRLSGPSRPGFCSITSHHGPPQKTFWAWCSTTPHQLRLDLSTIIWSRPKYHARVYIAWVQRCHLQFNGLGPDQHKAIGLLAPIIELCLSFPDEVAIHSPVAAAQIPNTVSWVARNRASEFHVCSVPYFLSDGK